MLLTDTIPWSFKFRPRKVLFAMTSKVTEMISLSSKKFIELARKHSDCETAQKAGIKDLSR